ncbi:hypothetical protein PCANC_16632 [Puccinia coronata f. sp. avenae]|uniref:Uncharacterized protein n=1 Tax=Puccinia coronata f. sp. avenae TaxID=200324 RepID=A0A2N5T3R7_9BASI|nr:hypothetical protein PCANC_16632 [Puccinia coronata f. sp. avenae]
MDGHVRLGILHQGPYAGLQKVKWFRPCGAAPRGLSLRGFVKLGDNALLPLNRFRRVPNVRLNSLSLQHLSIYLFRTITPQARIRARLLYLKHSAAHQQPVSLTPTPSSQFRLSRPPLSPLPLSRPTSFLALKSQMTDLLDFSPHFPDLAHPTTRILIPPLIQTTAGASTTHTFPTTFLPRHLNTRKLHTTTPLRPTLTFHPQTPHRVPSSGSSHDFVTTFMPPN